MSYFDGIVGDGIVNSYVKKGQMINEGGMSKYITMARMANVTLSQSTSVPYDVIPEQA
jgi:hypothetical protein